MLPSEALKQARRYILEFGWCQGSYSEKVEGNYVVAGGSVCAEGALRCILNESINPYQYLGTTEAGDLIRIEQYLRRAKKSVFSSLGSTSNFDFVGVTYVNDYLCQSVDDVVRWFDKAIELAESDERPKPNTNDIQRADNGVGNERDISSPSPVVVAV